MQFSVASIVIGITWGWTKICEWVSNDTFPVQCTYFISPLNLSIPKDFKQICSSGVDFFKKECIPLQISYLICIFHFVSYIFPMWYGVQRAWRSPLLSLLPTYGDDDFPFYTKQTLLCSVDNSRDKLWSRYNVAYLVLALSNNFAGNREQTHMYIYLKLLYIIFIYIYLIYIYISEMLHLISGFKNL